MLGALSRCKIRLGIVRAKRWTTGIRKGIPARLRLTGSALDYLSIKKIAMNIIKIHYKSSKPVVRFGEIKEQAAELVKLITDGGYKGFYNKAYAIAHCQVSENPYAFFVVAGECVVNNPKMQWYKMFKSQIIINPKILEGASQKDIGGAKVPNTIEYNEMCMSFPFRTPKRLKRFDRIKVQYQVPGFFGLKTVKATLSGVASEIFQHEYDHIRGKNIYFESETPMKWWELKGNDKPVGADGKFDPRDLSPVKEKIV